MRRVLLASIGTMAFVTAAAAAAQAVDAAGPGTATPPRSAAASDRESDTDLIVVTGSRLRRTLSDTIEPTQIINSQQIETRGYTNIGQALAELPAIAPGINGAGAQSAFGPGQTFVDFFGLGTQRTLTLVNGRRFVSSNTASIFGPTPIPAARSISTPFRPTSSTASTSSRSAARQFTAPTRSRVPSTSSSSTIIMGSNSTASTALTTLATAAITASAA